MLKNIYKIISAIKKTHKGSPDSSSMVSSSAEDNSDEPGMGRRLQDSIDSRNPGRKLNLDRRVADNERRLNADPNYKGPSRRYTIDRRANTKDRRAMS